MIRRPTAALAPADAARRAALGADPVWLCTPGSDGMDGRDVAGDASDASAPGDAGESAAEVRIARDVVACDPVAVVRGDSLPELARAWSSARARWGAGAENAGVPIGLGWMSYDLGRQWMSLRSRPPARTDGWPDIEFRFFDALWIGDARTGAAELVATDETAAARLEARLTTPAPPSAAPVFEPLAGEEPGEVHARAVERIRQFLRAGDVYQVNLARRLSAELRAGDPVWLAATLRERAPAPHAIWLAGRAPGAGPRAPLTWSVVGNSPERFLRVGVDGAIETRPIKGTRPRGEGPEADAAARAELVASAKDRAEHVMIVDLERNDLGRVCRTGSVEVVGLARVIALPTLFHLVSTVRGRLRPEVELVQLIQATFPGGSITGAPKRRAMEIIDELEPVRRGIYTGATGWLGAAGDLDLAVAIRTATVRDGRIVLGVGGGIVVDSDPAAELVETEVKARAFTRLASGGSR